MAIETLHPSLILQYTAATETCALFDLGAQAKIALTGPEAVMFLHNLSTQDVKSLSLEKCREAFLCTAKAKVVAHFWISHLKTPLGARLLLDADSGQANRIVQHLNHYLISEQVEIADVTLEQGLLRLVGPKAMEILQAVFAQSFADLDSGNLRDLGEGTWLRRLDLLALPTFDLFCSPIQVAAFREKFVRQGAVPADVAAYEVLRIEAGLPRIGMDMDENRFVVETGRIAQAISYTKGCYLGQEPIVMARDRGQVNRTLLGVKFTASQDAVPGTKLFRGTEEVGQVTSAVVSPRLGPIGLAYLRRGNQQAGMALSMEPGSDSRQALVASLPFGPG